MPADPELIQALEAAASANPDNQALRVHLAGLLVDAGRPEDAIKYLEEVMGRSPDHLEALELAARAGSLLGDPRATGWSRLHDSLARSLSDGDRDTASVHLPSADRIADSDRPAPEGFDGPPEAADWDQFLHDVLNEQPEAERITLADVGGFRDVKERLQRSFFAPLRNPDLGRTYGAHVRGGLLLVGFLAVAFVVSVGSRFWWRHVLAVGGPAAALAALALAALRRVAVPASDVAWMQFVMTVEPADGTTSDLRPLPPIREDQPATSESRSHELLVLRPVGSRPRRTPRAFLPHDDRARAVVAAVGVGSRRRSRAGSRP